MKKKTHTDLYTSVLLLTLFVLWTLAVSFVDVKAIGPNGSSVGFSAINAYFHALTGVNMFLYHVTDWLGLVPIFVALGFALLGLVQWIKRKRLCNVDNSLFILGGFYIVVIALYLLFETVTVNYRPVLIDGFLETSYPSSTTLLVMCVMPTARMQWDFRIKNAVCKRWVSRCVTVFTFFMVAGRFVSGVHWFTDIVGSILLSTALTTAYRYAVNLKE